MSKIDKIPKILDNIHDRVKGWKDDIELNGKNIQSAIVEQASLIAFYDQISVEASYIVDYMEVLLKQTRAERIKFIKDNFAKDYTDTAINKVVEGDKEFVEVNMMLLEAKECYEKCKSIVDAFKQRGYCLNNLVKIYENELDNITIRM